MGAGLNPPEPSLAFVAQISTDVVVQRQNPAETAYPVDGENACVSDSHQETTEDL